MVRTLSPVLPFAPVAIVAIVASVLLVGACDQSRSFVGPEEFSPRNSISGSGNVVTQSREIGTFNAVSFRGIGHLEIQQTGTPSLTVSADDNLQPFLVSEVVGGTLELGVARNTNLNRVGSIEFRLTAPRLDALEVEGAASVEATDIDTERLVVFIVGASSVTMAGRADRQDITVTGASSYDAAGLDSRTVQVDVDGASTVIVRVRDTLTGRVSGASSVVYIGDPTVDVDGPPGFVRPR